MLNKRKYPRIPIINNVAREVFISTNKGFFQGIIVNLSAAGMLVMMYENLSIETKICFLIDYLNIETSPIFGKVVRVESTQTKINKIAIEFNDINKEDINKINNLALDFIDCDKKIILGVENVCFKECSYYNLCDKSVKLK